MKLSRQAVSKLWNCFNEGLCCLSFGMIKSNKKNTIRVNSNLDTDVS